MITFDPAKDAANLVKHGVALSSFSTFDEQPIVVPDVRRAYGERRLRAFGRIGGIGFCLVFTPRGNDIRLISLRRVHAKEMAQYVR